MLLDVVDSPFAMKSRAGDWKPPLTRAEKFQALFIATEICRLLPPTLPEHESFLARYRRRRRFARFYRRSDLLGLFQEEAAFLAYLADYRNGPVYAPPGKDSRPLNSPYWLYEAARFQRFNPHREMNTILAMSPGEIGWRNAAAAEAHDQEIKIMTEARLRTRDKVRAKNKEVAEKREARQAASAAESRM